MEREPNEPNSNSKRIIFRTYLILIGIDLVMGIGLTIFATSTQQYDLSTDFPFILILIALYQGLIMLPAALILSIFRKWEIINGMVLAELTLLFLSFFVCMLL